MVVDKPLQNDELLMLFTQFSKGGHHINKIMKRHNRKGKLIGHNVLPVRDGIACGGNSTSTEFVI